MNLNKFNYIFLISILLIFGVISIFTIADVTQERPMTLDIGNQAPNITNVELNDGVTGDDSITLTPRNKTTVWCAGDAFELDGYPDFTNAISAIWNSNTSSYSAVDDNRWHYTNDSCLVTEIVGTPNLNARINCSFDVFYYANFSEWACVITINDTFSQLVNGTDNATVERLLAVNIVNTSIDWGARAVDVDYDADLDVLVENEGNVILDLQIDAYNDTLVGTTSDSAFDCDIGQIPTDSIVFNYTSGGIYAESLPFSIASLISADAFDLSPQTGTAADSPTNLSTYFGINVPSLPTINGTCTGFMRFDGVDGSP